MIANQQQGLLTIGRILRQGLQLHHEAFPQVTRTHARWVEMLQKFAGDVEVVRAMWDAWERLKTLEPGRDKRESAGRFLNKAAAEPALRARLEQEAGWRGFAVHAAI